MKIALRLIALICLGGFLIVSCKDDDNGGATGEYTVNLKVEKPNKYIELSWARANFSGFEGYYIVRSTKFIEEEIEPMNPLVVIEDLEATSFVDSLIPLEGEAFYKVYVKLGENYLPSETVGIQYSLPVFGIEAHRVVFDEKNNILYLFDVDESLVFRLDLTNNELTHVLELDGSDYVFHVGDAGMGDEFFASKVGSGKLQVYDASDLTFKEEMNAIGNVQDIEVADGVVILAANQSNETMTVYNRSDWSKAASSNLAEFLYRNLKLAPGESRSLIDAGHEYIVKYDFDENWNIISEERIQNWNEDPLPEIQFSPDGGFFITDKEGDMFDLSLNPIEPMDDGFFFHFDDYVFLPDGQTFWGLRFSNSSIFEMPVPPTEFLDITPLAYQPVQAFRTDDGKILMVGKVTISGEEQTYIDWFEF